MKGSDRPKFGEGTINDFQLRQDLAENGHNHGFSPKAGALKETKKDMDVCIYLTSYM